MLGTAHVFDFLNQPVVTAPSGICAIFGGERFLKKLAVNRLLATIGGESSDFSAAHFDSDQTAWADVHDELATRSLFGGDGPRIVVVDHADKFVSQNRDRLMDYLSPPKKTKSTSSKKVAANTADTQANDSNDSNANSSGPNGLLILIVDTWASNTKLYKAIDKTGLQIKCDLPFAGRSKNRDDKKIADWIIKRAKQEYGFTLSRAGSQLVIDSTDAECGRMDQELQKLVLYADKKGNVPQETIKQVVGGWRSRTMWDAIEAAVEGDAGKSLTLLDQLLRSGEHPLALFGQMSWSLRRYATATETVMRQLRAGRKPDLKQALEGAGFLKWNNELAASEERIKQLGSQRSGQLAQWLLEADLALKLSHSKEDRGRLVLETLFVRMAKELALPQLPR